MKISKLFHWLYACLMLLPIFAFGVTGIYYALNQTATQSETIEQQPIYYESNQIESTNDYVIGNIYKITDFEQTTVTSAVYLMVIENNDIIQQVYSIPSSATNLQIYQGITQLRLKYTYNGSDTSINFNVNVEFVPLSILVASDNTSLIYFTNYVSEVDTNIIKEYLPITTTNSVSTSVINAWNDTWSNSLFSWSQDSFLTAPFEYVTNLFSIPSNNTFSMALSYWLAISIIYLVFDLVMYVPLLAHRWIDKGMVE